MGWEPDEAIETAHASAYSDEYDKHGLSVPSLKAALVAAGPLIEEAERSRVLEEALIELRWYLPLRDYDPVLAAIRALKEGKGSNHEHRIEP